MLPLFNRLCFTLTIC